MPKKYNDLWDQLTKNSIENGECLDSTYVANSAGLPYVTHKGKLKRVSRAAWEYHHGLIPKGIFVCHHCDNHKCFRLSHLFLGTPSANMQDMVKKRRDNTFGHRKYSFKILEKVEKLREEGHLFSEIAQLLGMTIGAVASHCCRHKIKKGKYRIKPRKFPLNIIDEVNEMIGRGMSDADICQKFGMSESTLYRRKKNICTYSKKYYKMNLA